MNDADWESRDDSWVVGEDDELILWIPADLHRYACGHRNISVLGFILVLNECLVGIYDFDLSIFLLFYTIVCCFDLQL